MRNKSSYAILSAALALALAGLACAGGAAAPTSAPTPAPQPTQAVAVASSTPQNTAVPATKAPTEALPVTATKASPATATTAPTEAAPTKAPLSGTLDVHAINGYVDSDQFFHVVGLVTNGTDKPVSLIQLALQLTDASGKSVLLDNSGNPTSTMNINTLLVTLDSGETAPFAYDTSTNGADGTGWKYDVKLASSEPATNFHRVPIEVQNDLMTVNSSGTVYLTGELVNKSDKPAQIDGFAGALLDGPDKVAGAADFGAVSRLLAPTGDASGSDRTPFSITLSGPIKAGATPTFYVDGIEGDPNALTGAADVHLKLENSFIDADNGVHVVATIKNSGTNTMTVRVVAGLYDEQGKVLDAGSVDTPVYLAPGDSVPVPFYYFSNVNGNTDLVSKIVSDTAQIDPYWTFPSTTGFVTLKASNVTSETSGSKITFKGDVINSSSVPLNEATIVVTLRDPAGKLVAADWTTASNSSGAFAPKSKQSWSVEVQLPTKVDPSTLSFDMIVQGYPK